MTSNDGILGLEFGSTRIKATLINPGGTPLGSGTWAWENQLKDGLWTYTLDEVWTGARGCLQDLTTSIQPNPGTPPIGVRAAGISGMMHGYLAFDADGNLLVPFRTWRNTVTAQASAELTKLFGFPIPQRWSIAHLHQAFLNQEPHVPQVAFITTLAGYVHWKLTGQKVVGLGEASGIFPIDPATRTYDQRMIDAYSHILGRDLLSLLPRVLGAGDSGGPVTAAGAALLQPSTLIPEGTPLCPPEGDAGTGMVATNSIRPRSGNISVGTSVFGMVVLEKPLSKAHEELDLVATPDGSPVAMAHSNNGLSDLEAWINLFHESTRALGLSVPKEDLYKTLLARALTAEEDAGGILSYGYLSGEHITGLSEGRPLLVRNPESTLSVGNLFRSILFSAFSALRLGFDILTTHEGVRIDELKGHGGIFRTPEVGLRILAAATGVPARVSSSASEGGAWGMALLAAYMVQKDTYPSLQAYLDAVIDDSADPLTSPRPEDLEGFARYLETYKKGLTIERAAVSALGRPNP